MHTYMSYQHIMTGGGQLGGGWKTLHINSKDQKKLNKVLRLNVRKIKLNVNQGISNPCKSEGVLYAEIWHTLMIPPPLGASMAFYPLDLQGLTTIFNFVVICSFIA